MNRSLFLIVLILILTLLSSGCDSFDLNEVFAPLEFVDSEPDSGSNPGPDPDPDPASDETAIVPANVILFANQTIQFAGTGGDGDYTFSIETGAGAIDEETGEFTAPVSPGSTTIRVTCGDGSFADASVQTILPITITPSGREVPVDGTVQFAASGGTGGYTYEVVEGDGGIAGTTGLYSAPAVPGSAVIRVTDSIGTSAVAGVTITPPQPLRIEPSSVTIQESDSVQFTATGGSGDYEFTVLSGVGSVDPDTGEYTAPASSGTAVVRVQDLITLEQIDAEVTIVEIGELSITPTTAFVPVNGTVEFYAFGGVPDYQYTVVDGPGTINAAGIYTAGENPDAATVQVRDSLNDTVTATITIAGAGCGQSFAEQEPNDDSGPPFSDADDSAGIDMSIGCAVTITGVINDAFDVFEIEVGDIDFLSVVVSWTGASNAIDVALKTGDGTKIAEGTTGADDVEFTGADVTGMDGDPLYILLERKDGNATYTITLSGS